MFTQQKAVFTNAKMANLLNKKAQWTSHPYSSGTLYSRKLIQICHVICGKWLFKFDALFLFFFVL